MANNTIKGLTIEIGGDTTKLGKALDDVNKKSRDLSGELGQINKLLKLDPGNTDLLAQKQKVLAAAVENTADKLKTLKDAEKQVQKQFERGEVSEAQVRALQREIIETERKMDSYKNAIKQTDQALKGMDSSTEQAGQSTSNLGEKLGGIAKGGVQLVAGALTAATGALIASAEASREYRAEMGKLDAAFTAQGHSAETAQAAFAELQGVIGETDQSVEAAQQISLLADSEQDVARWASQAAGVVGQFGDALQPETFFEAANETIKLGEATGAYTQMLEGTGMDVEAFNAGLAACTTEAEKQAFMLQTTEAALGAAGERYRETNAEVIRANEANNAWAESVGEVGAAVEPVLTDIKLLGASLLADLAPGIKTVTDGLRGMLNGEDGAAEDFGEAISGMLSDGVDRLAEMLPTFLDTVTGVVTTLVESVLETFAAKSPGILEAVIESVNKLVNTVSEQLPELIPLVIDTILKLVDTILAPESIDGMIDAGVGLIRGLSDGILEALPRVIAAAPEIIGKLVGAIARNLPKLLALGIELTLELTVGIIKAIPQLVAKVPQLISAIVKGLASGLGSIKDVGEDLVKGLWNGIDDMVGWITKKLKGFSGDVLGGIKSFFGIKSPSRVFRDEIGKQLALGLADGIEANAKQPLDAMASLSRDLVNEADLDGMTLERRLQHTFKAEPTALPDLLTGKLDQIYQAILKGQVIMLDGKLLVGSTADQYDSALGQRRLLTERGAL